MNKWRDRFQFALMIAVVMLAHGSAASGLANTPAAMLVFYGSAALLDWMLALVAPFILVGRICKVMQCLFLASIVGNFAGWLLYMKHFSPVYFNTGMWILTAVQCVCLFGPDLRDAITRMRVVSRADSVGSGHNY